uniref:Uncharacterized protein n=1 Tax=Tanacetum cinerariifolium TaxID=118510 RepID=A0A6L2LY76_TANCI|nr:hypothetical protein [Tanacetum cinerariifolium]
MDEVDGKKFVENGFKLNKTDKKVGENHEIKSSEVVDNNIDLKNLVEVVINGVIREVIDEFDGKKFVENGFKLNKIDESQVVGVDRMENCEEDGEDHEIESSEVVDNNIDLKILVEVRKERDKDEGISSKELSRVKDNNTYFMEMTAVFANIRMSVTIFQYNKAYHIMENQDNKKDNWVKCNEEVRNFVNSVAGMEIDQFGMGIQILILWVSMMF